MARVVSQSIPSEYEKMYKEIARPATEMIPGSGLFYTQGRYPFKMSGKKPVYGYNGTPAQNEVRDVFKQCCECFGKQPKTGGYLPPDIGPRARTWWFGSAIGSGLWYYNYFMKASLNLGLAGFRPDWCKQPPIGDTYDRQDFPNVNYHTESYLFAYGAICPHRYVYIRPPEQKASVFHIKVFSRSSMGWLFTGILIWRINEVWDETTETWNTRPGLVGPIYTLPKDLCQPGMWINIPVSNIEYGIAIGTNFNEPQGNLMQYAFYSSQYSYQGYRPFWT